MIKRLILSNFRNFSVFRGDFERINIIKGKNGSGKTNLIEAIYFCLNGHPFTRNLKRILRDKNRPTHLSSEIDDHTVQISANKERKTIKLDGKPIRVLDLKKRFPCVDYSINSFISFKSKDYIFSLIDRGIFAKEDDIINKLIEYKKLMNTKRDVLKKEKMDTGILKILNERIVDVVNSISDKRKGLIDLVKMETGECFGSFYNKRLSIEYTIGKLEKDKFREEIEKRRIIVSLKKDSIKILIDDMDLFLYSSFGEKKIALLCIVLAIVKLYNTHGKLPVFLVDDLEGDLDYGTQKKAFEIIESLPNQIFITTLGAYSGYNTIAIGEDDGFERIYS